MAIEMSELDRKFSVYNQRRRLVLTVRHTGQRRFPRVGEEGRYQDVDGVVVGQR